MGMTVERSNMRQFGPITIDKLQSEIETVAVRDGLEEIASFALGPLSLTNVYKNIKIFLFHPVRMCERIILWSLRSSRLCLADDLEVQVLRVLEVLIGFRRPSGHLARCLG